MPGPPDAKDSAAAAASSANLKTKSLCLPRTHNDQWVKDAVEAGAGSGAVAVDSGAVVGHIAAAAVDVAMAGAAAEYIVVYREQFLHFPIHIFAEHVYCKSQ